MKITNFFNTTFLYFKSIFGCAGSSLPLHGLSLAAASGGYSPLQCMGLSLQWLLLWRSSRVCRLQQLRHTGSAVWPVGPRGCGLQVACGFSSCGRWTQSLSGTCSLPRPGIKPTCPALAGRLLSNAPPGKSKSHKSFMIKTLNNQEQTPMSSM